MAHQRRAWATERLAWAALAALVAAGLLGAFGRGGWLSDARATTEDGALSVRYQRVQRLLAQSTIEVAALSPPADGTLELRLGRDLLDHAPPRNPETNRRELDAAAQKLEEVLRTDRPKPGEYGVMMGFGPGLTVEGMLVRF